VPQHPKDHGVPFSLDAHAQVALVLKAEALDAADRPLIVRTGQRRDADSAGEQGAKQDPQQAAGRS